MTHIEASNTDPDHFRNRHTKLTMSNDKVTVIWAMPDRLLKGSLLGQIMDELAEEFKEREASGDV